MIFARTIDRLGNFSTIGFMMIPIFIVLVVGEIIAIFGGQCFAKQVPQNEAISKKQSKAKKVVYRPMLDEIIWFIKIFSFFFIINLFPFLLAMLVGYYSIDTRLIIICDLWCITTYLWAISDIKKVFNRTNKY